MSFFLAAQQNPIVTAIAPVAGTMMQSWATGFHPASHLPVMAVNIRDDKTTLWKGDIENRDGWGSYLGTEAVIELWTKGLSLSHREEASLEGLGRMSRWSVASKPCEVRLYAIDHGDHHWPHTLGDEGKTTAESIWLFFERHYSRQVSPQKQMDPR